MNLHCLAKILVVLSVLMFSVSAHAYGKDWSDLEGYVLIAHEDVQEFDCPWRFDLKNEFLCEAWPDDYYKFGEYSGKEFCFEGYNYYTYSKTILFSNGTKYKLVKLDYSGAFDDIEEISPLECLSEYMSDY